MKQEDRKRGKGAVGERAVRTEGSSRIEMEKEKETEARNRRLEREQVEGKGAEEAKGSWRKKYLL